MKEWTCILINHHDNVGKAVMDMEQQAGNSTRTVLLEWVEHSTTPLTITCSSNEDNKQSFLHGQETENG